MNRRAAAGGAVAASLAVFAVLDIRRRGSSTGPSSGHAMNANRAARTVEFAKLGTKTGANLASTRARSAFASSEKKVELQEKFELQTAEQVAELLGNMKGAIMKIGQMASYLDGGLPEPVREVLAQMQSDAPPMSYELVAGVIRRELGGEPGEIFATFDRDPIAAASIGQVHRATTNDGRSVAVKVQYPGVDEAIRADLNNSDLLFGAMSMLFSGMDPGPIVEELRERLLEELDYRIEAENQQIFVDYFAGHPTISVPNVVYEFCSERVLCTEFAHGEKWAELLTWSQEERDLAAETIYRFAFGGIYRLGVFNGDPHPGNYLFNPGGRVVFLDFGLCKRFTPEELGHFEKMIDVIVLNENHAEVRRVWTELGLLTRGEHLSDEEIFEYFAHFFEQVRTDEVMTITPEYASASLRRYFDLSGPHAEMMKSVSLPSFMVIGQRINLGLYALFGDLHATANWRKIAEEVWPFTEAPPSTPMGEQIRAWEISRGYREISE